MIPDNLKFGGGISNSNMHPAVLALMVVAIALILFASKQRVMPVFIAVGLLVPLGQQIVAGGQHFLALRILTLAGVVRVVLSRRGDWDPVDKLFLWWAVVRAMVFCLLFWNVGAVLNQAGFLLDYVGGFFLLRFLVQDRNDAELVIRTLVFVAMVLAAFMLIERYDSINVFGYLGGSTVPTIRDGAIRARGPFAHPLLAGTFGSTLLPLTCWLWVGGRSRILALAGVFAAAIITITSASSTPVMAFGAGILGIGLWPMRNHLRWVRWGIVIALAGLQVVMKAPVWFLIARVDLVGGSSGYHRAMLVDQFITHFSDWWLIGTNSNGTWGWDMWDTCNQFVTEGYTGGVIGFACFVGILWLCFRRLGNARRANGTDRKQQWFLWLLGVTLFAHVVAFFGIVYFDQIRVAWFALLAMITAATTTIKVTESVQRDAPADLRLTCTPPEPELFSAGGEEWVAKAGAPWGG